MPGRLEQKIAIGTGAGTGIGQAIACLFAREGALISICGRTVSTLGETARRVRDSGGEVLETVCDVGSAEQVRHMVCRTAERFGGVNMLVNNAGVRASIGTILDLTEEEWQRTFDIDAKGSWLCSKYAIPYMQKNGGGSVVMVS